MESLHPLKVWIEGNTTQAEFARKVGCSGPYLSDLLNGKRGVSLKLAIAMSRATGGAVPIEAFEQQEAAE
ncbi:MAG: XRE family transcriptional regulator [Myxococcales bacterium]|nr:MAG: XRE family transcriptional regulator [Myxococcales bacterium]